MAERNPMVIMRELIESLSQAAGGAGQMVHQHRDPRWMSVRSNLELVRDLCIGLITPKGT